MDDEQIKSIIDQTCSTCFRKDECMLVSDRHAGVEFCLGPFKSQEDREKKIREDNEAERQKANLRGYVSEYVRDLYRANIDRLRFESRKDRGEEGESNE